MGYLDPREYRIRPFKDYLPNIILGNDINVRIITK